MVCTKHEIPLNVYKIPITFKNYYFVDLDDVLRGIDKDNLVKISKYNRYLELSESIEKVYNGALDDFDLDEVKKLYNIRLMEKGYYRKDVVSRKRLLDDFVGYYSEE